MVMPGAGAGHGDGCPGGVPPRQSAVAGPVLVGDLLVVGDGRRVGCRRWAGAGAEQGERGDAGEGDRAQAVVWPWVLRGVEGASLLVTIPLGGKFRQRLIAWKIIAGVMIRVGMAAAQRSNIDMTM